MIRYLIGIILTVLWVGTIAWLHYDRSLESQSLTLNEYGDFLAGAIAPITFLWLILGYLQQGHELKLNTQALLEQKQALLEQKQEFSKSTLLSAYIALAEYESNEVNALNNFGEQYKKGAQNARERAKSYKELIEKLACEIESFS